MPNAIQNTTDEKHWRAAKRAYDEAVERGKRPANKWAYVMETFERIKNGSGSEAKSWSEQEAQLEAAAYELQFSVANESAMPQKAQLIKRVLDATKLFEIAVRENKEYQQDEFAALEEAVRAMRDFFDGNQQ